MKAGLLNHTLAFLFASGFLYTGNAQTCPQQVDDFVLNNNVPDNGKISDYRSEINGEKIFGCDCNYKDISTGTRKIFTRTYWVETQGGAAAFGFNNMCKPNPQAIPGRFVDPKLEVYHPNKSIYTRFTVSGPNSLANTATAKKIATQMIATMEWKAAFCKNAGGSSNTGGNNNGGMQPGNMNSCDQQLKQLTNLEQQQWAINRQIRSLQDGSFNEHTARDSFSYFSLLTAAIKTHNATGVYDGAMYTEVNRLKNDPAYRAYLAKLFGISPDMPAITITRSIRDHYAAKIDHFKDRAVFIQRYNTELRSIEKDLTKLHREIALRQCPGDYDMTSCNLAGNWTLSEWDDEDGEWYPEPVTFLPVKKGIYSTFNKRTGRAGEAVIAGRELIYIPQPGYYRNYRFVFGDNCNASEIVERHEDYTWRLKIERNNNAINFFIQDQLVEIAYNGITYQGLYKKQSDNNIPIDVFYFRVLGLSGYHIEQEGQRLWGRFVRKPSTDHPDQSTVQWWLVTWVYENDKWVIKQQEITAPVIR